MTLDSALLLRSARHLYNLLLAVDASGDTYGNYRKAHIFDTETRVFETGNQLRHIDVEFPASARTLAVPLDRMAPDSVDCLRQLRPEALRAACSNHALTAEIT